MNKPTTRHDTFIRSILADKTVAIDYFRTSLPAGIVEKLDFSSLIALPDTYISKELRKTMSDIVYSCGLTDGSGTVKISLLIEHKSYVDHYTPVQIGSYMFSGLLKQVAQKVKKLSPILPILLYHGREKWEYKTLSDLFEGLDEAFLHFVPDYEYVYHNLGDIPDEAIRALHNKFLAASFLALKYSRMKDKLERWIPTILRLALTDSLDLQKNLIVYTFESSGLKEDRIVEILKGLPFKLKDTVMSTLDIFVEKGRKEGLREGRKEGFREGREKAIRNLLRQSSLTDEQIASVFEVPAEYVSAIRQALEDGK